MLEQNLSERIKQFKKIDAHSHVGYFGSWCDVGITPEELIAQMDEYNVEKSVICTYPIQDSLDAVDKYPDRLVGAAWLNPMDPDCLDILKDAVKNHNFKAVKLHPLEQAYCPNDECVFPIAELAQELEIPLMIHTGHPPFSLPWSVAQLADIYPDLPMVMIHMGHGNGMFIQSALDMAKKYPNLYLETSGMPMHTKIKESYKDIGSDRIMWGLDAPFHHPAVEMLKPIVSGLTDEELEDCRRGLLAGMNGLEDTLGGIETWYYMEVLRGGPVQTPDDARAALQAVTEEDVRTVLRQLTLSVSYLLTREEESAHA